MGEQALFWTGEGLQFEARTGHGLPFAVGGERDGDGAKPADLLPVSLAACTAYDVVVILRKQRQDLRGLRVQITSHQEPDAPWTFTAIHLHFVLTGSIDDRKAGRAIELSESKYCSVAATIRPTVALTHSHEIVEP
jgi:putative redox protein